MPTFSDYNNRGYIHRQTLIKKAEAKLKVRFPHLVKGSRDYDNVMNAYLK